jgi:carbonic anhydrase
MQTLIAGYRRFRAQQWPDRRKDFEALAQEGQTPQALVVACIDSRVDPAMIFDAAPGELLIVRNVGNLVPPYNPDAAHHGTSAALEFGVQVLNVKNVIVLGHGTCSGVQALLKGAPEQAKDFIGLWMSIAEPARRRAMQCGSEEERQRCCEQEVIKLSLGNLLTFPWIAERVRSGELTLHGAWFAIHSGLLLVLQPDGTFAAPAEAMA